MLEMSQNAFDLGQDLLIAVMRSGDGSSRASRHAGAAALAQSWIDYR